MKTIITSLAIAGLASSPAAFADQDFAFGFKYDASELKSDSGTAELYKRLKNEIEDECEIKGSRELTNSRVERECIANTLSTALRNISSGRLTAYHQTVTGSAAG